MIIFYLFENICNNQTNSEPVQLMDLILKFNIQVNTHRR